jgi:hypothetical protein
MGAGASTPPLKSPASTNLFPGDELSRRRLQAQGMNNKEIYQHYRETYGSLRLQKKIPISENTIRGLAIQKLSNTLETQRVPILKTSTSQRVTTSPDSSPHQQQERKLSDLDFKQTIEEKKSLVNEEEGKWAEPTSTSDVIPATAASKIVIKKKKPNLNISIQPDEGDDTSRAGGDSCTSNLLNHLPQNTAMKTPREYARISPSGAALYIGDFAINEYGITHPHFDPHHSFLTSGISDFVMIGKLGRGASGSVVEAIHIPTLTIVALKLLPIRDSEDLHHISSELGVLYQNLAELSLLGELPDGTTSPACLLNANTDGGSGERSGRFGGDKNNGNILVNGKKETAPQTVKSSCPQVLAMYDGEHCPLSVCVSLSPKHLSQLFLTLSLEW